MAEFEFVLPHQRQELLNTTGNNYCVTKVLNEKECTDQLRNARLALTEQGVTYIFDYFDVFYSIIEIAPKLQLQTVFRAQELLYKSIDALGKTLADFLAENNGTQHNKRAMLNALKMFTFAIISLVKKVDLDLMVFDGKKQKKNSVDDMNSGKWQELRYSALLQLFNILQLPLGNLWDPPVAEESFVNLCADFAYRTIEHNSIKQKNVEDTSFQLLGTLLKSYNHAIVFPTRIFELMKASEMSAISIANGAVILYEHYGIQTILKILIDQILDGLSDSMNAGDGPVVKNISSFFTELGNTAPTLVMPFLRDIASDMLNLESYQLRICILKLMADIVMGELTGEELTNEDKDTRDEYLEHIYLHMHDINAHVRSKAVTLWTQMKQENAVPLSWLSPVMKAAVGRLEDKSVLVRKNSIHLIKSFLERNPFAAKLSLEELEKRYEEKLTALTNIRKSMADESEKAEEINGKWDEILAEMKPNIVACIAQKSIADERIRSEDCLGLYQMFPQMIEEKNYERLVLLVRRAEELNGNWAAIGEMEPHLAQVYFAMLLKSYYLLQNSCKSFEEDYKTTENAVRFLEDSLEFSRLVVSAVPKLQELLMSKVESDVSEAIDFFTSAYQFGIKNTESGMRQILYLVWALSKEKRGPVRDAYKSILFTTNHTGRAHAVKAVKNLMQFIEDLTFSQFVAFEELVKEFVQSEDIDKNMIQVMFEYYTKKLENVTNNESRLALQLLVICSGGKASIARANAEVIQEICFTSGEGEKDSRVFTLSLEFLMNTHADKEDEVYSRLEADDKKVLNVLGMFKKYFLNEKTLCFDEVCSKTFQYIYNMCHLPNIISQDVIKDLWAELMAISKTINDSDGYTPVIATVPDTQNVITQENDRLSQFQKTQVECATLLQLPVTLAARFVFLIGYVAMKELIYLDVDVFSNLKYRQDLTDSKKNKKNQKDRPSMMNVSSAMAVKHRKSIMPNAEEEDNEDDLVGQSNDDAFAEQINAICEKELLSHKDSIFRKFIPMIVEFLKYPSKFNHPDLQRACLLSLVHIMSVSSEFCERNMQFLMNIFAHAQDIDIKCNVIIGMSDLTFRFPNVIEPWSAHMYSTLHDENRDLRLTSVRILAHLISHEMILVKGQISDLAMCLVDHDDEIRVTTQVFFKEIANKSNILYNVLPDIISRLSDPKLKLEEGKYQTIMKFIIGLINKDRQIEGLVEKLCYRFKVTEQERQWRDIAYCLSLLSYTEKTIKKLIEHIVLFRDKVQVDEVYNYFRHIISSTSKQAKPELKAVVQDFEMKLEECLSVNTNKPEGADESPPKRAPQTVHRPGRTTGKKGNQKKTAKKPTADYESSDSDEGLENHPPKKQKGRRRVVESDSEEEVLPRKTQAVRPGRATKVIQDSTSSDAISCGGSVCPSPQVKEQPASTLSSFANFKTSFTSNVNFLKRRFSSGDLTTEADDVEQSEVLSTGSAAPRQVPPPLQQQPMPAGPPNIPPPPAPTGDLSLSFGKGPARGTSAPSSPAKSRESLLQRVQSLTGAGAANLIGAAANTVSRVQAFNKDRCFTLLVIDDQNTDWSKYFRGKRLHGDYDIRVEQAEFGEISVVASAEVGATVSISPVGSKSSRSFRPDFVLVRQAPRDGAKDYRSTLLGFKFGGVPSINSLNSLLQFQDRPNVFAALLQTQRRLGKDQFPLIEQHFFPSPTEMCNWLKFPCVLKAGHCHGGKAIAKLDIQGALHDAVGLLCGPVASVQGSYCCIEPFVDSKYDILIQKIGSSYKAFMRKSMTGNWKTNQGSAMLEQMPITEKYKNWIDEVSELFGGLEICSLSILVGKDGKELILKASDCTFPLIGDTQEEDRRSIADIVCSRMQNVCRPPLPKSQSRPSVGGRGSPTEDMPPMSAGLRSISGSFSNASGVSSVPPPIPERQTPGVGSIARHGSLSGASMDAAEPSPSLSSVGRRDSQASQSSQSGSIRGQPSPARPQQQSSVVDEAEDTMKNLRKTFAGIFGDM